VSLLDAEASLLVLDSVLPVEASLELDAVVVASVGSVVSSGSSDVDPPSAPEGAGVPHEHAPRTIHEKPRLTSARRIARPRSAVLPIDAGIA
jgi:hypothetical protein